ncbi:transcriptional regulator [Pseudomonas sp. RTB3]|uniref:helix-turn-helix domain-containing protein n=1 Tax=unclassified Pseudomonas TaxID=196821 RepID=UPI002B22E873|nr:MULTISPECIES: transcriptional regulator [unclassified Pseudomonas]MEB0007892.1 transcriptional regulator [Pseudomonas sp. RTB2]MEB0018006.1 transcriptional regulator [Pseudomonas sp. RTB3]MEB0270196.1 transcriptional regulator [Pseudomonas sp. 5B4]
MLWPYRHFWTDMSLRNEVAAAIRVIRRLRGLGYEELAEASAQANISSLEQGKTNITLDKLTKLATVLDFDPVTLVAICIALQKSATPREVLEDAIRELDSFDNAGGLVAIKEQFEGENLSKRSRGKPANKQNAAAVLKLKAEGMSQAAVVRELGLAKSTVQRYWQE